MAKAYLDLAGEALDKAISECCESIIKLKAILAFASNGKDYELNKFDESKEREELKVLNGVTKKYALEVEEYKKVNGTVTQEDEVSKRFLDAKAKSDEQNNKIENALAVRKGFDTNKKNLEEQQTHLKFLVENRETLLTQESLLGVK